MMGVEPGKMMSNLCCTYPVPVRTPLVHSLVWCAAMTNGPLRVLILDEETVFRNGIEALLAQHAGLEIIGSAAVNSATATAEIERIRPDVVILNEQFAAARTHLVMNLLNTYPDLQIVALSLDHNRISVYSRQEVHVTTTNDVVSVLTGGRKQHP